jgi:hypothetical protein
MAGCGMTATESSQLNRKPRPAGDAAVPLLYGWPPSQRRMLRHSGSYPGQDMKPGGHQCGAQSVANAALRPAPLAAEDEQRVAAASRHRLGVRPRTGPGCRAPERG